MPTSHTTAVAVISGKSVALFAPSWSSGRLVAKNVSQVYKITRLVYGGLGQITIESLVDDSPDFPKVCRARLVRQVDGVCIQEIVTKADGTGGFFGIDPNIKYIVYCLDPDNVFRAVIADNLTPDPLVV